MIAITHGDVDRFVVGVATAALPAKLVLFLVSLRCGAAQAITGYLRQNEVPGAAFSQSTR